MRPVGPRPPYVYWTRRLVLIAVVVVLVVLLAHACSGGSAKPSGSGSPTPTPTGSTPTTPTKPTTCAVDALTTTASVDATTYPSGALPQFTAEVRNTGTVPCRLPTRQAARTWSVFSGNDQVWTTGDCPREHKPSFHRLGVGKGISYVVTWDRHRSVAGCVTAGDAAQPGTYRLYVTIAGSHAKAVIFHLTD